ncbi:MAG: hypothetical protein AVDCRST_MAG88-601, partial [uncultured Thermomicrobiales bacterium]
GVLRAPGARRRTTGAHPRYWLAHCAVARGEYAARRRRAARWGERSPRAQPRPPCCPGGGDCPPELLDGSVA